MGRGGDSSAVPPPKFLVPKHVLADSPLAHCPVEELRKYAEQRGIKNDGTREDLLVKLKPYAKGLATYFPAPKPLPLARPPFKFSDLQKAIPRHCFKRDLATSCYHLASDLVLVATFGYLATLISNGLLPLWAGYFLWPLYWFVQGTQMTGVWVIAHECGHQAFSESKTINNLVGLVCHSALLVPYHSWRITHAKHHNNTGSCSNDEVFCPTTRSENGKSPTAEEDIAEVVKEAPLVQIFWIFVMLAFGWMPGYLVFNATGPSKYRGLSRSHFNPWAKTNPLRPGTSISISTSGSSSKPLACLKQLAGAVCIMKSCSVLGFYHLLKRTYLDGMGWSMFEERDRVDIVISDLGFFVAVGVLGYAMHIFGVATVVKFYLMPYMVTNLYLVLITYLQHTDVFLPHLRGKEWNWFRGALCTVDRSFGSWIDHVIHHITDTHVCHHLFSKMPFYHAQEATEHIRAFLGSYYMSDPTPIVSALWRSYNCCRYIEDVGDVAFYQAE